MVSRSSRPAGCRSASSTGPATVPVIPTGLRRAAKRQLALDRTLRRRARSCSRRSAARDTARRRRSPGVWRWPARFSSSTWTLATFARPRAGRRRAWRRTRRTRRGRCRRRCSVTAKPTPEWTGSSPQVPVGMLVICLLVVLIALPGSWLLFECATNYRGKTLSSQVLSPRVETETLRPPDAGAQVLRRELEAEVLSPRGLTINDFEALLHLSTGGRATGCGASTWSSSDADAVRRDEAAGRAPGGRPRRERPAAERRPRHVGAADAGRDRDGRVRRRPATRSGCSHCSASGSSQDEVAQLSELLGRLPGVGAGDCAGSS